jgi:hypothetical protein
MLYIEKLVFFIVVFTLQMTKTKEKVDGTGSSTTSARTTPTKKKPSTPKPKLSTQEKLAKAEKNIKKREEKLQNEEEERNKKKTTLEKLKLDNIKLEYKVLVQKEKNENTELKADHVSEGK